MAKEMRQFLQNPAHLIIFLPLIILVAFVAANISNFQGPDPDIAEPSQMPSAPPAQKPQGHAKAQSPVCPQGFGCCAQDSGYLEKPCAGGQACVNNTCEKKACGAECCDDESSSAEYAPKACDNNFLCEGNKCVQRKCWKECCTGDPAFEEKQCPGIMECIGNLCEKPACPDNFLCCPSDDSTYRQKDCPGRGVCKFRVCRSALSR